MTSLPSPRRLFGLWVSNAVLTHKDSCQSPICYSTNCSSLAQFGMKSPSIYASWSWGDTESKWNRLSNWPTAVSNCQIPMEPEPPNNKFLDWRPLLPLSDSISILTCAPWKSYTFDILWTLNSSNHLGPLGGSFSGAPFVGPRLVLPLMAASPSSAASTTKRSSQPLRSTTASGSWWIQGKQKKWKLLKTAETMLEFIANLFPKKQKNKSKDLKCSASTKGKARLPFCLLR